MHERLCKVEHDDILHGFGHEVQGQARNPVFFDCTEIGCNVTCSHVAIGTSGRHCEILSVVLSGRNGGLGNEEAVVRGPRAVRPTPEVRRCLLADVRQSAKDIRVSRAC